MYLAGLVSLGERILMALEHPASQSFQVWLGHLEVECPALYAIALMDMPDQLGAEGERGQFMNEQGTAESGADGQFGRQAFHYKPIQRQAVYQIFGFGYLEAQC